MLLFFIAFAICYERLIIPYPNQIEYTKDKWEFTAASMVGYDPQNWECEEVANLAAELLRKSTGFTVTVTDKEPASGIYFGSLTSLEKEEYTLTMDTNLAKIVGGSRVGMFWGFQSLRQLLPPEIYLSTKQSVKWIATAVNVQDKPRYPYRGVMADPARRWLNVTEMEMIIDHISSVKMNHLHVHFADDQGWRVEIKKFPELTNKGAYREASPTRWNESGCDNTPYGPYFYTDEEIRGLVKYGRDRGVILVPEIEMPGHSIATLSGYPQYSCTGGPFKPLWHWGIQDNLMCAGNDETFTFLQQLIDEVLDIFNDTEYVHVGGDESPKTKWQQCPKCQNRMEEQGLTDWDALEQWFIGQISKYVESKGKQAVEWDDYCDKGIPDGLVVEAWRYKGSRIANQGHYVIMAPATHLYVPRYQYTAFDGYEYVEKLHSLRSVYHYDPTDGIEEENKKYVLGVEAPMWGEHIWNISEYDWKMFPRGFGASEIGWTLPENLNWSRFFASLARNKIEESRRAGIFCAGITINPAGEWHSGELPDDSWVDMQWNVMGEFEDPSVLEIAFIWTGGSNALKMRNVQIIVDGVAVGEDTHEGRTFDEIDDTCFYSITSKKSVKGAKTVVLKAEVYAEGGSDTSGNVYVYSVSLP